MRRMSFLRNAIVILFTLILFSCGSGYKNDGKKVTYYWWNEGSGHGSKVIDADPATFEDLGDDYARDAHHAFRECHPRRSYPGTWFCTVPSEDV